MATMTVLDSVGGTQTVEKPLAAGTAADAASRPVAWSTEGKAQLGAVAETAPATDTASSGLNGRLQRIAQRVTSMIALLPTALGAGGGLKVDGSGTALPVTVPTDPFGANADAASATGSISAKLKAIATVLGTTAWDLGSGTSGTRTQRVIVDSGQVASLGQAASAASMPVVVASDQSAIPTKGSQVTCSTDITRPADTTAYTANDAWSDSTSAPTAGGFTLTGAARASGGSGVITDIFILSSAVPGTLLQGELHIFDSAATAVNDNAAYALSDADAKLQVAMVPFTLLANASNSFLHVQNLNVGFTCVGTANLRYLVKVKNAYTPISAEVLTVRTKIIQSN